MKYVVKVNFEIIYCSVYYLNANCERVKSEAYTENGDGLFLLERKVWKNRPHNDMDVYAFELDGSYVKSHVDAQGYITKDRTTGTCDVSTHFREMIRFGYYDPILPKNIRITRRADWPVFKEEIRSGWWDGEEPLHP